MEVTLILGNQLFDPKLLKKQFDPTLTTIFMREDVELCTYYKFHKNKIIFFLSAMKFYRDELKDYGFTVHYEKLAQDKLSYEASLRNFMQKNKVKKVRLFEIEDKFFEARLRATFSELEVEVQLLRTPMFLTSREQFENYLKRTRKPFMKTFYEAQRKRLKILIDKSEKPVGGRWSFDEENRKPLPTQLIPPSLPRPQTSQQVTESTRQCEQHFADHPGDGQDFWLPVTRKEARDWLKRFCEERLAEFGPYEDALAIRSNFVFHSVLTPFLNTGLLTPDDVVRAVLKQATASKVPIASLEGFIRQVIGWREFVRGIYQNFSEEQDVTNYWKHKRKLSPVWWQGDSGIPQLDRTLAKVLKFGYCHHIERLMVLGNLMLLLEVDPRDAHRWFMEMFVDSSDWVMGPNVYGMALFSDGGIFATKPYICGSNYWRKMSKEKAGDWCDGVDGLYWKFIDRNRQFFTQNPRLSMMVRTLEKMDAKKKTKIFAEAELLRERLTTG